MKPVWIALALLGLSSTTLQGQGKEAKPQPRNYDLLWRSWRIDSMLEGDNKAPVEEMGKGVIRFLSSGTLILWENETPTVFQSEVLYGKHKDYIHLVNGEIEMYWRFEKLTAEQLLLKVSVPGHDAILIYCSPHNDEGMTLNSVLAGHYFARQQYEENLDEPEAPELMLLENGRMYHRLSGSPDSGAWNLDNNSLHLELKGSRQTLGFSLKELYDGNIGLQPDHSSVDSLITLFRNADYRYYGPDESRRAVEMRMMDSLRMVDSMAAAIAQLEAEIGFDNEPFGPIAGSWKLNMAYTSYPNEPMILEDLHLTIEGSKEGKLQLRMNQKEYDGTWKGAGISSCLLFTLKKKEQLVGFQLMPDYSDTEWKYNRLLLTFIPPGEKQPITVELSRE